MQGGSLASQFRKGVPQLRNVPETAVVFISISLG